jgi:large subunit ribosomal protein L25
MASKSLQLAAQPRTTLGSRANKRLRDSGFLPGVIYGHKEAVVPVTLPKKELSAHLSRGAHVFDVSLDGRSEKVLVKDVQYDHLGIELLHVDFARVSVDERVEVTVPLQLKGEPKGEAEGGVLQQIISDLEIECLVTEIPDAIVHNVANMAVDDVLHIRDLTLPAGVKATQDPDGIVATVKVIAEDVDDAAAAAAAADAAEPEVIGRKAEDADAPGGEAK